MFDARAYRLQGMACRFATAGTRGGVGSGKHAEYHDSTLAKAHLAIVDASRMVTKLLTITDCRGVIDQWGYVDPQYRIDLRSNRRNRVTR